MCCERCDKYDECEYKNGSCCWECEYYEECYGEDVDILDDDEEEEDYDPQWVVELGTFVSVLCRSNTMWLFLREQHIHNIYINLYM